MTDRELCQAGLRGEGEVRQRLLTEFRAILAAGYQAACEARGAFELTYETFAEHTLTAACRRVTASGVDLGLARALDTCRFGELLFALALARGSELAWRCLDDELDRCCFQALSLTGGAEFKELIQDLKGDLFQADRTTHESRLLRFNGASSLLRWLITSLTNRLIDRKRRERFTVPLESWRPTPEQQRTLGLQTVLGLPADPAENAIALAEKRILSDVLPQAFAILEPREQTLFKMCFLDGRTQRAVAAALGIGETSLSKKLSRAGVRINKRALELLTREHGLSHRDAIDLLGRCCRLQVGLKLDL